MGVAYTQRDWEPIRERIVEADEQGLSLKETAALLGVNERTVCRYRARFGLSVATGKESLRVTEEWKEQVRGLMAEGVPSDCIAEITGVAPKTVYRHFPEASLSLSEVGKMGWAAMQASIKMRKSGGHLTSV